jgi:hypothetical protein
VRRRRAGPTQPVALRAGRGLDRADQRRSPRGRALDQITKNWAIENLADGREPRT